MSKSKFVINKIAKIFEQGLVTYNDLSDEIINILKSKKEEIINKLEITSKEEFEVLKKRVENLENGVNKEDLKFYRKRILQQTKNYSSIV